VIHVRFQPHFSISTALVATSVEERSELNSLNVMAMDLWVQLSQQWARTTCVSWSFVDMMTARALEVGHQEAL